MAFRVIKWAMWPLLGWWLYRSLAARGEKVDETARPDRPAEGLEAGVGPAAAALGDDLRRIRGIGPGIQAVLRAAGITTWAQLAAADVAALRAILDHAGPRYRPHDPATWPAQASELAAAN